MKGVMVTAASWKNSQLPFAFTKVIGIAMAMPLVISDYLLDDFTNKMTFVFSNVPGPRAPITTTGKKTLALGFFVPAIKSIAGGFGVISYVDRIKIGILMDESAIPDPAALRELVHKNLDTILGKEWRNFQK